MHRLVAGGTARGVLCGVPIPSHVFGFPFPRLSFLIKTVRSGLRILYCLLNGAISGARPSARSGREDRQQSLSRVGDGFEGLDHRRRFGEELLGLGLIGGASCAKGHWRLKRLVVALCDGVWSGFGLGNCCHYRSFVRAGLLGFAQLAGFTSCGGIILELCAGRECRTEANVETFQNQLQGLLVSFNWR